MNWKKMRSPTRATLTNPNFQSFIQFKNPNFESKDELENTMPQF